MRKCGDGSYSLPVFLSCCIRQSVITLTIRIPPVSLSATTMQWARWPRRTIPGNLPRQGITSGRHAPVFEDLKWVNLETGDKFIFIMDEWDMIFHQDFIRQQDKAEYLNFLRLLLKGRAYVALAYMTGILPIAKYSSGSELNMFLEYTMASEKFLSPIGS